jgi:hypothetical protein
VSVKEVMYELAGVLGGLTGVMCKSILSWHKVSSKMAALPKVIPPAGMPRCCDDERRYAQGDVCCSAWYGSIAPEPPHSKCSSPEKHHLLLGFHQTMGAFPFCLVVETISERFL